MKVAIGVGEKNGGGGVALGGPCGWGKVFVAAAVVGEDVGNSFDGQFQEVEQHEKNSKAC